MAYGTLGFGLLSGAFTQETTFGEGDWRSDGTAEGIQFKRFLALTTLPKFAGNNLEDAT